MTWLVKNKILQNGTTISILFDGMSDTNTTKPCKGHLLSIETLPTLMNDLKSLIGPETSWKFSWKTPTDTDKIFSKTFSFIDKIAIFDFKSVIRLRKRGTTNKNGKNNKDDRSVFHL